MNRKDFKDSDFQVFGHRHYEDFDGEHMIAVTLHVTPPNRRRGDYVVVSVKFEVIGSEPYSIVRSEVNDHGVGNRTSLIAMAKNHLRSKGVIR